MKCALISNNKIKFIHDKLFALNEDNSMFNYWGLCNRMIVSWITCTLFPRISQSVYIDNAEVMCNELCHQNQSQPPNDKYRLLLRGPQ